MKIMFLFCFVTFIAFVSTLSFTHRRRRNHHHRRRRHHHRHHRRLRHRRHQEMASEDP